MSIRRYSNLAPPLPLATGVNETAPTLTVSSTAGYPEPPFILAIERGTPDEEACLCTDKTGTSFTVERGWDDTIAKDHHPGDFVEHVHSAIEFRESKIVRLSEAERDSLFPNEVWPGRVIFNETNLELEYRNRRGGGEDATWTPIVPTGVVLPFAGLEFPDGWVQARGQELNRTDYSKLFDVIGTTYGVGNGTSTFNVPNLQRRFPLGKADVAPYNVLNSPGGSMDHFHTVPPAQSAGSHAHTNNRTNLAGGHAHGPGSLGFYPITGWMSQVTYAAAGSAVPAGDHKHHMGGQVSTGATDNASSHDHAVQATDGAGGHGHAIGNSGQANPPFIVLNYIIKA